MELGQGRRGRGGIGAGKEGEGGSGQGRRERGVRRDLGSGSWHVPPSRVEGEKEGMEGREGRGGGITGGCICSLVRSSFICVPSSGGSPSAGCTQGSS